MAQQRRRPNTMVYGNLAYDLDTLASQRQLDNYDQEIKNMQLLIDDQKNKMENYESYQEQQARENGQARPGESIYKEIPGA